MFDLGDTVGEAKLFHSVRGNVYSHKRSICTQNCGKKQSSPNDAAASPHPQRAQDGKGHARFVTGDHLNVIKLHATFQDVSNLYFMLEYGEGKELWSKLRFRAKRKGGVSGHPWQSFTPHKYSTAWSMYGQRVSFTAMRSPKT